MALSLIDITSIVTNSILLLILAVTVIKVYRGSKSNFAYILLAFALYEALVSLANSAVDIFRHPVSMHVWRNHYITNEYMNWYLYSVTSYGYFFTALQSWVFAHRYMDSALKISI